MAISTPELVTTSLFVSLLSLFAVYDFYLRPHLRRSTISPLSTSSGTAISVSICQDHTFSKSRVKSITLLAGLGVEGDAHCGKTVQHRPRLKIRPPPPNLRQVHLIQSELFREFESVIGADGRPCVVKPGDLGENITTSGLDLLALGVGTKLYFHSPGEEEEEEGREHPMVTVTGLRNPCPQISQFQKGLQERCWVRNTSGEIVERKAGIMTTVDTGGVIRKGARIVVVKPDVHIELRCV